MIRPETDMKMQTPVSDRVETKGLVYFARMLDKIRLKARGELPPDYFVGVDDDPTKRKSRSGMRFLPSVDGEMTRAQTCKQLRSDQVSAIATTSKPGWICTTPKKAEP